MYFGFVYLPEMVQSCFFFVILGQKPCDLLEGDKCEERWVKDGQHTDWSRLWRRTAEMHEPYSVGACITNTHTYTYTPKKSHLFTISKILYRNLTCIDLVCCSVLVVEHI